MSWHATDYTVQIITSRFQRTLPLAVTSAKRKPHIQLSVDAACGRKDTHRVFPTPTCFTLVTQTLYVPGTLAACPLSTRIHQRKHEQHTVCQQGARGSRQRAAHPIPRGRSDKTLPPISQRVRRHRSSYHAITPLRRLMPVTTLCILRDPFFFQLDNAMQKDH